MFYAYIEVIKHAFIVMNVVWLCQDAYENELENSDEQITALLGQEHAQLYPLITKLVIACCQMTKR